MKKYIILILSAFTFAVSGLAQEKMNLLMKNGSVLSYNVADILSFYFTEENQNQELAENCGITVNDELALTDMFALELNYESGVEYIRLAIFTPDTYNDAIEDDALVAELERGNYRYEKNTTIIAASQMPEGKNLTVVFAGYDNQGRHGPVYRHHVQTHIGTNEPKAVVSSCQFDDNAFFYTIEMDNSKAQCFYLFEELYNDYEWINTAVFGMLWRRAITDEPQKALYNEGKTFTRSRPNGEKQLYVATWALDFNSHYSGYIFEGLYDVTTASAIRRANVTGTPKIVGYNKEECLNRIRSLNLKVVHP